MGKALNVQGCALLGTLILALALLESSALPAQSPFLVSHGKKKSGPTAVRTVKSPNPPKFRCPKLPTPPKAKHVRELRPGNVKVVMALGDSITAGFGIEGRRNRFLLNFYESRGKSWSIGGDEGAVTFPNMLKNYSPDLVGYSTGTHLAEVNYLVVKFNEHNPLFSDNMNAALTGGMCRILPSNEVPYLRARFEMYSNYHQLQDEWKIANILVGANDLCLACFDNGKHFLSGDGYRHFLNETMAELHASFPKLLVAVTQIFNVSQIYTISQKSEEAMRFHRFFPVECQCAFDSLNGASFRKKMDERAVEYNKAIRQVGDYWNSLNIPDFGVAVLPTFTNAKLGDFEIDFISTVDYFHPSAKAHGFLATSLWSNLLRLPHERKTNFDLHDPLVCPTEDSLFHVG
eukprot:Nk52_evm21s2579 gene=Nk52_evmTU21s2579